MDNLISLIRKKPIWLGNEGHWRILQILRILAAIPFVLTMGVVLVESAGVDAFVGMGALAVAAFFGTHLTAWVIAWVVSGFSEAKEKA